MVFCVSGMINAYKAPGNALISIPCEASLVVITVRPCMSMIDISDVDDRGTSTYKIF